jgi:hypothetical protein
LEWNPPIVLFMTGPTVISSEYAHQYTRPARGWSGRGAFVFRETQTQPPPYPHTSSTSLSAVSTFAILHLSRLDIPETSLRHDSCHHQRLLQPHPRDRCPPRTLNWRPPHVPALASTLAFTTTTTSTLYHIPTTLCRHARPHLNQHCTP